MYVRASMLTADPAKIDAGLQFVKDKVQPALEAMPGCRGMSAAIDRESGQGAIVSWWDDLDSLRASDELVRPMRDEGAKVFGGTLTPQVLEIIERHVRTMPTPGCWNRVSRIRLDAADIDTTADTFRTSTIPALEAMDGFCAATLSVDREGGLAVAVTTWRDLSSAEASRERASGLRQEVVDKSHGSVESVQEMEIVLFSMRTD